MKKIIAIVLVIVYSCTSVHKTNYESYYNERNEKILKGIINRSIIEKDSAFKWFAENKKWGKTDSTAIDAFSKKQQQFTMVVFGGTWCEDTQALLPVFYRLVEKSSYPEKNITLIGVDRNKQTLNNLHIKYNIKSVPTFIVMHNGKEVGRVVEYGKYGTIDRELGEIVAKL
jgi:thiol-disulfide isomerase/thioredoxin